MATEKFFDSPFDDGTKIKLEVFKQYLIKWLPTFTKRKEIYWKDIFIYDFFAGKGQDSEGNDNSSLIIINELKRHYDPILQKELRVNVLLNDKNEENIQNLQETIERIEPNPPYKIKYYKKDFIVLFNDLYPKMFKSNNFPMLMFLDQFGIKQITKELLLKIVQLKSTDFLFFISSGYLKRFADLPEFQKYLEIKKENFNESKPYHCHRIVFDFYRSMLPDSKDYYLAPFSIKKGKNIYGLIFGSNHTLGIEKFLDVCWKINPTTGDANFNIDEEKIADGELSLFPKDNIPQKLQLFENELKRNILDAEIETNQQIYDFTFNFGCLPKHANKIVKEMVDDNIIAPISIVSQKIHKLESEKIRVVK